MCGGAAFCSRGGAMPPPLKIVCAGERDGMLLEPLVFTICGAGGTDRCVELWTNLPTLSAPAVAAVSREEKRRAHVAAPLCAFADTQ